jgi:RNA recognition motif-containing protein
MNIYIGNLPYQLSEDEVRELFGKHGEVLSVKLIADQRTGRPKGFGFLEMDDDAAKSAIEALNGYELKGRKILVNQAHEREQGNRPPRRDFH